jgi:hypothetical protein
MLLCFAAIFFIVDIDPRPGLSFFRDGEYRYRA